MVIALDADVLSIYLLFQHDARFPKTADFMRQSATVPRGLPIYTLLELCGVAKSHGHVARQMFQRYVSAPDMEILYPPIVLGGEPAYWKAHNEALLSRVERGMRLGDAAVLWVVETCDCEALITWNMRHFAGKTALDVLTPAKWLERFAEKDNDGRQTFR